MSSPLFSPHLLGTLRLSNRVVMAPMTRSRATPDHTPTPIMAEHYAARADAGLLITEGTAPDANGCGYARIPGIWSVEQAAAWSEVTDAVHARGGRIAIQLMHTGRVGHPLNQPEGAELLAPSAVPLDGEMYTDQEGPQPHPVARAMTEAEIEAAVQGYVEAARNAVDAGFDLIELHGANGYLIDQFLSPNSNLRTDGWGGDLAGRARFALTVARRVVQAIGSERVGIRLSPGGVFNGILPWDAVAGDFTWLAGELGAVELAYLHLVDHSSMGAPPVAAELKAAMGQAFGGSIILSGGYDRDRADADLAAGRGQLVAFGRPFISNPDLVTRLRERAALNDPDFGTFYAPGAKGYNDYPTLDPA
ncbi:MAG: alkene reductase [Proteobacteria bacterium]|nr:alkene reductase [Pseudomonadota bacterium]MCP4918990.1 alkene reductase [Pseudomonadota bacterium]